MRLLLDTCSFLWIAEGSPRLSAAARDLFRDPANDVYLSAVSVWEIAVKHRLGRLPLPQPPERYVPGLREAHRIESLPVDEPAALHLSRLPNLHRDPFDRMLISQALVHGLVLVTPDEAIRQYPVRVGW